MLRTRRPLCLLALGAIAGCSSSVAVLIPAPPVAGVCEVAIFQTRAQAVERGAIEELCIVSGSSSGSFRHNIATAIEKQKDEICQCGATNAYVESRSDSGLSVATATLVGFRYRDQDRR